MVIHYNMHSSMLFLLNTSELYYQSQNQFHQYSILLSSPTEHSSFSPSSPIYKKEEVAALE